MSKRVLVVEDDDDTRTTMVEFVSECGFQATAACNAVEGIRALRGRGVFAILTDQMLGPASETGSAMLSRAQREGLLRDVAVITICTGSSGVEPPGSLPSATVIRKPVDLEHLRLELFAALDRRS